MEAWKNLKPNERDSGVLHQSPDHLKNMYAVVVNLNGEYREKIEELDELKNEEIKNVKGGIFKRARINDIKDKYSVLSDKEKFKYKEKIIETVDEYKVEYNSEDGIEKIPGKPLTKHDKKNLEKIIKNNDKRFVEEIEDMIKEAMKSKNAEAFVKQQRGRIFHKNLAKMTKELSQKAGIFQKSLPIKGVNHNVDDIEYTKNKDGTTMTAIDKDRKKREDKYKGSGGLRNKRKNLIDRIKDVNKNYPEDDPEDFDNPAYSKQKDELVFGDSELDSQSVFDNPAYFEETESGRQSVFENPAYVAPQGEKVNDVDGELGQQSAFDKTALKLGNKRRSKNKKPDRDPDAMDQKSYDLEMTEIKLLLSDAVSMDKDDDRTNSNAMVSEVSAAQEDIFVGDDAMSVAHIKDAMNVESMKDVVLEGEADLNLVAKKGGLVANYGETKGNDGFVKE